MQIDAIIFDLDGTIADTIPITIYSLKEVTKELTGKTLSDEEILKEFGPIDTQIIKNLFTNDKQDMCEEVYIKHFTEHFDKIVKPIDGMKELISYIKSKGIKLGIFTGRSLRATHIILEKLGILNLFDAVIAGDSTKKPKPDPEGINIVLKELGVKNANSIYAGDFDVDIQASRNAGTMSVLALWSSTGSKKLIELKPDKYFETPYEFIDWLKEIE